MRGAPTRCTASRGTDRSSARSMADAPGARTICPRACATSTPRPAPEESGMITDIASYLRFFESLQRRTERDVAALPPQAAAWRPRASGGEAGWSIGQIVRHIGGSRLYFASAYRGEGWIWEVSSPIRTTRAPG